MKTKFLFLAVLFAAMAVFSCNNDNEVLAVRLDKVKVELVKGESVKLNATVVPADASVTEFEWFSEDENYVTVENGLVTAMAVKKVSENSDELSPVSVFVRYGKGADECEVTVKPLATQRVEIQKSTSSTKVKAGETLQLQANCFPEDADLKDLKWSTDNALIAVVDENGLLTGKKAGICYIKAAYSEQVFDEVMVVVEPVSATSVKLEPEELTLSCGQRTTLKVVLYPEHATDQLLWTSSDLDVVKIYDSSLGMIEAVGEGTAKVKVAVGTFYAECTVTVTNPNKE